MPGFAASVVIDRTAVELFGVVSDVSTHPRWAANSLNVQRTGERTWRSIAHAKGRTFHADLIVTAIEPDRMFEFVASDETGTYRHRFTLDPVEDGCRVERSVTVERLGRGQRLLYWLTLVPVRKPALRTSLERLATTFW